jgi:hypothetical protein
MKFTTMLSEVILLAVVLWTVAMAATRPHIVVIVADDLVKI